jgi:DNA transposition AAA+ family ATPase
MILIAQPLGIDHAENTFSENFRDATNALKDSTRTVIFDEGEHLHVAEHEIIRRLQDFTHVPIILAGTDRLEKTLRGKRGELKQLSSRIAIKTLIPLLTLNDTKLILESNFPEAARFYETLHSVCKKNGRNLENLQNLLRYAIMKTGCSITESLIYESATRLLTQPN